MRYQHAAQGADRRIAQALSALATPSHGADAVAVDTASSATDQPIEPTAYCLGRADRLLMVVR